MSEPIHFSAITPESLAKLLSAAYRRKIEAEDIEQIIGESDLLSERGTLNLLEFAAFLLKIDKNDFNEKEE